MRKEVLSIAEGLFHKNLHEVPALPNAGLPPAQSRWDPTHVLCRPGLSERLRC